MKAKLSLKHRLLFLLGIVFVIAIFRPVWGWRYDLWFNERFNSQFIHLRQINEHIQAIALQWQSFTNQNPGCAKIQLFSYTGGDGMFAALGEVDSEEELLKLRRFMESTSPPRPIDLHAVMVVDPAELEFLQKQAQPVGAANRGQPVGSETNRMSSAAGHGS